jgi:hypothetical protein
MKTDHFIQQVEEMRNNQKMYFKTRNRFYLQKSKECERVVDNHLSDLKREQDERLQPKLF